VTIIEMLRRVKEKNIQKYKSYARSNEIKTKKTLRNLESVTLLIDLLRDVSE